MPVESISFVLKDPNKEIKLSFDDSAISQHKHIIILKLFGKNLILATAGEKREDAKKRFQEVLASLQKNKEKVEITCKDGELDANLIEVTRGSS